MATMPIQFFGLETYFSFEGGASPRLFNISSIEYNIRRMHGRKADLLI